MLEKSFKRGTELRSGELVSARHQREAGIWDQKKKNQWIKYITEGDQHPIGVILTYELKDLSDRKEYLNDGLQRISTTNEFLSNPKKYGSNKKDAKMICDRQSLFVQHRVYHDHLEAMKSFQSE